MLTSIRFVEFAGQDCALIVGERGCVAKFAFEDALAQVTTINFGPAVVKFFACVTGLRGATFDF